MRRLLRGLGPNVIALGIASFFTDFGAELVVPLLPEFLRSMGATTRTLGWIEGIADSLASIFRVVSGWLSDRLGRRKIFVLAGYGIASVARPFFGLAKVAWHVGIVRIADRFGKGLRLAARDALIADSSEPFARGKAFGFQKAMDHFGATLGPLLAMVLLARGWDYRGVFFLTAIPAAMVLLVIGGFVRDVPSSAPPAKLKLSLAPFDANFKWFLLTVTVFTLGNSSDLFILWRGRDLGIPQHLIPLAWSGICFVRALASIPGGMLADRFDRRYVVIAGLTVYASVYAGLAFAQTWQAYLVLVLVYGLYHALAESVFRAIVTDIVPAHLWGTAFGMFHFCMGVAFLPASIIFGTIMDAYGPAPAFLTGAAMAAISAVMMLRVRPGVRT
jgi:MFS family permease